MSNVTINSTAKLSPVIRMVSLPFLLVLFKNEILQKKNVEYYASIIIIIIIIQERAYFLLCAINDRLEVVRKLKDAKV